MTANTRSLNYKMLLVIFLTLKICLLGTLK